MWMDCYLCFSEPTPADKGAVEKLEELEINLNELGEEKECSICQIKYGEGDICTKIPCGHLYHRDCIKPWLSIVF